MAYRVFLGGVPAWADHGLVKQWCWHNSLMWPDTVQVVRRWPGETQLVCFLCFQDYNAAATALDRLKCVPFHGNRITAKWSKDSKPPPDTPKFQSVATTGAPAAMGATGAAPAVGATVSPAAMASTGATASGSTVPPAAMEGTGAAPPAAMEGTEAPPIGATVPPAAMEATVQQPPPIGATVPPAAMEAGEDTVAPAAMDAPVQQPPPAEDTEVPQGMKAYTPTEGSLTPTSPAVSSPSSECPTVIVPEGQEQLVETSKELYKVKTEALKIKEEIKEEIKDEFQV